MFCLVNVCGIMFGLFLLVYGVFMKVVIFFGLVYGIVEEVVWYV